MHLARRSAKIYQFPTRIRTESNVARMDVVSFDPRTISAPATPSGSGWYHEAAIEDAQRKTKH